MKEWWRVFKWALQVRRELNSISEAERMKVIDDFHRLYYNSAVAGGTWRNTTWLGTRARKCPLDLWIYQEIISTVRPGLIIETGTKFGGSALFMATICDSIDCGEVVTVDIVTKRNRPQHRRLRYLQGSSTDPSIVTELATLASISGTVLVVLDSYHGKRHVYKELSLYSKMVSVGSYIIVEDTHLNGNPVFPNYGDGPNEAVAEFLRSSSDFVVDEAMHKFLLTYNRRGYLKKIA